MTAAARGLNVGLLGALVLAVGLAASADGARDDRRAREPAPAVDTADADRCDFLDPSHCLYPWPNDHFTREDTSTDTGRRLDLELASMPRNDAQKPIDPTDQNRNDGFSPGNMIITKVPGLESDAALRRTGAVRITDMARYRRPGAPVVVINARTGRRHPVWAEVDANPEDPEDRTLIVRPSVNFEEGARYIVALRRLRRDDGSIIPAGDAFRIYRDRLPSDDEAIERRRDHMEGIFRKLRRAGIARHSLFLAWDFTVASERNLSERMLSIRDDAFGQLGDGDLSDLEVAGSPPAFTVEEVTENPDGPEDPIARRVEGRVTVPCYLNLPGCPSGSRFAYSGPEDTIPDRLAGNTTEARFTCHVPRSVLEGSSPARPALYGHGLLGSRGEIGQGQLRALGDDHGFVFCATDWIGMSCADLPDTDPQGAIEGILEDVIGGNPPALPNCDLPNIGRLLVDLSDFSTLTDRVQQGMLNFLFLGRTMVHQQGFNAHPAFQGPGGRPLIDSERLFYDGNSQGGIIGGALAAVAVDHDRAVLGVPGMNYSTLLRRSVDFDTYAQFLYASYPDELERPLILSLIQLLWDRAEANGYAHHMASDPLANTPPHEIMLHPAFGDHQVANVAAEVEARTIGARTITPYLDEGRSPYRTARPWGIPPIGSFPFRGSAIVMWDSGSPTPPRENVPPRDGEDPHEHPRNSAAARKMKSAFLSVGGRVINTCNPGPCYANGYTGAGD